MSLAVHRSVGSRSEVALSSVAHWLTTGWVTAVSLVLAAGGWLAAIAEWRSARIARQELDLALRQDTDRKPRWLIHLERAQVEHLSDQDLITFIVSIVNQSDSPNSIIRADVRVDYSRSGNQLPMSLYLPMLMSNEEGRSGSAMRIPFGVPPRGAEMTSIVFSAEAPLFHDCVLHRYTLTLTDSFQTELTVTSTLPTEIHRAD
jgi:hypothetical protein